MRDRRQKELQVIEKQMLELQSYITIPGYVKSPDNAKQNLTDLLHEKLNTMRAKQKVFVDLQARIQSAIDRAHHGGNVSEIAREIEKIPTETDKLFSEITHLEKEIVRCTH